MSDRSERPSTRVGALGRATSAEVAAGGTSASGSSVLIAGGGTAGHIEPAIDRRRRAARADPAIRIIALGTERGLETSLVPQRGYELRLVPAGAAAPQTLARPGQAARPAARRGQGRPGRCWPSATSTWWSGFGGYVCLPAYLAARGRVPIVVHEANARAGLANKVGARFAARARRGRAPDPAWPEPEVVGIPVRANIAGLDRAGAARRGPRVLRARSRRPDAAGVRRLAGCVSGSTRRSAAAATALAEAGVGVLHAYGRKNTVDLSDRDPGSPPYVALPYVDRMDLAYAAADLALGRSGAMTVAELGAVGLPAVYVPLPHGNGEQRLNADRAARGRRRRSRSTTPS